MRIMLHVNGDGKARLKCFARFPGAFAKRAELMPQG